MGYTPDYWEREGKEINKRRRDKYHNDPEYREARKQAAREYRARKRAEQNPGQPEGVIVVNGVEHEGVTTAEIASQYGISPVRLKYLQRAGYIPHALVTRPARLYTAAQVAMIVEVETFLNDNKGSLVGAPADQKNEAQIALDKLVDKIKQQWET